MHCALVFMFIYDNINFDLSLRAVSLFQVYMHACLHKLVFMFTYENINFDFSLRAVSPSFKYSASLFQQRLIWEDIFKSGTESDLNLTLGRYDLTLPSLWGAMHHPDIHSLTGFLNSMSATLTDTAVSSKRPSYYHMYHVLINLFHNLNILLCASQ